jgi:hypothetical protein
MLRLPFLAACMANEDGMRKVCNGNKTRKPQIDNKAVLSFLGLCMRVFNHNTNYLQNQDCLLDTPDFAGAKQRYGPELNYKTIF